MMQGVAHFPPNVGAEDHFAETMHDERAYRTSSVLARNMSGYATYRELACILV
jgi:hypothetical protein